MRLIISGGRDYFLQTADLSYLDSVRAHAEAIGNPITIVLHGGETGADACGKQWAENNKINTEEYKAEWRKYGNYAGPKRNREMAQNADAVVLFPDGDGTKNMYFEAKSYGLFIFDRRRCSSYNIEQFLPRLEKLMTDLHCLAKGGPALTPEHDIWNIFDALSVETSEILRGIRCSIKYA